MRLVPVWLRHWNGGIGSTSYVVCAVLHVFSKQLE